MAAKRDRVGPTWAQRLAEVQGYYSQERAKGVCKVCGRGGYVQTGSHPSGLRGQPVKIIGPDLDKLKEWIAEAGWVCHRCAQTTGAGGGGLHTSRRAELAGIRKRLALLRKVKQTPELCLMTQERVCTQMGVERGTEYLQGEPTSSGRWLHPHEFQALLDREQELMK